MNIARCILCVPVMLLSAAFHTHPQENVQTQPPPKYRIELVYIFAADSPEFIFVIGSVGFKSVASLKKFLSNLPSGSTLEWAPGCKRVGGEPLLSSDQEMEEFKAFCAERGINFILIPSG